MSIAGNNQLKPCPDKPNCINTQYSDKFKPITYPVNEVNKVLEKVKAIIIEMGGKIIEEKPFYLHATFTSQLFNFVDDFEVQLDNSKLYVRSASRSGYYDFGVNKARIENFYKGFN